MAEKKRKPNCWKVILTSRRSCNVTGTMAVAYPKGEWATAKVGGLLAFSSIEAARHWERLNCEALLVVPAYGADAVPLPQRRLNLAVMLTKGLASRIWKEGFFADDHQTILGWPQDTVAYKHIMCLE